MDRARKYMHFLYTHVHMHTYVCTHGYVDIYRLSLFLWVPLSLVCLLAQSPVCSHPPNYTRLPLCSAVTLSLQRSSPAAPATVLQCHPYSGPVTPCLCLPSDWWTQLGRRERKPNVCFLIRRKDKQRLTWDYLQWLLLCSPGHLRI